MWFSFRALRCGRSERYRIGSAVSGDPRGSPCRPSRRLPTTRCASAASVERQDPVDHRPQAAVGQARHAPRGEIARRGRPSPSSVRARRVLREASVACSGQEGRRGPPRRCVPPDHAHERDAPQAGERAHVLGPVGGAHQVEDHVGAVAVGGLAHRLGEAPVAGHDRRAPERPRPAAALAGERTVPMTGAPELARPPGSRPCPRRSRPRGPAGSRRARAAVRRRSDCQAVRNTSGTAAAVDEVHALRAPASAARPGTATRSA